MAILRDGIPSKAFNFVVNCHQIELRLNWPLIFTVTPTSEGLFAPLAGCLCHLGAIIIGLHSFLAQYFEPLIVYILSFPVEMPVGRPNSIAKRTMRYSLSYVIRCVCSFHCQASVAVLDGCTVGTNFELLNLLWDVPVLRGKNEVWCRHNTRRRTMFSLQVLNPVSRIDVHEVPAGSASWILGHFVFVNLQNSQVELRNRRNSSIYILSSCLHLHYLFLPYYTHRQHPDLDLMWLAQNYASHSKTHPITYTTL